MDTLLIAVTGYADRAAYRLLGDGVFDQYLVKPVDPLTLERLLVRDGTTSPPGPPTRAMTGAIPPQLTSSRIIRCGVANPVPLRTGAADRIVSSVQPEGRCRDAERIRRRGPGGGGRRPATAPDRFSVQLGGVMKEEQDFLKGFMFAEQVLFGLSEPFDFGRMLARLKAIARGDVPAGPTADEAVRTMERQTGRASRRLPGGRRWRTVGRRGRRYRPAKGAVHPGVDGIRAATGPPVDRRADPAALAFRCHQDKNDICKRWKTGRRATRPGRGLLPSTPTWPGTPQCPATSFSPPPVKGVRTMTATWLRRVFARPIARYAPVGMGHTVPSAAGAADYEIARAKAAVAAHTANDMARGPKAGP